MAANHKVRGNGRQGFPLPIVGWVAAIVITISLLGLGAYFFYQAPRTAFDNLRVAASTGDMATIEEYVDFPSLRASVKSYLIETGAAPLESQPEASGPIARQIIRLGKLAVGAVLDPVIELAVSPLGISALLDGFAPAMNEEAAASRSNEATIIDTHFESTNIFVVSIYQRAAGRWVMQLVFVRSGFFDWKLAAIQPIGA